MGRPDTIRVVLDVERGGEPISGRVTGPDRGDHEFFGWTALASAIDRIVREDGPPAAERPAAADATAG